MKTFFVVSYFNEVLLQTGAIFDEEKANIIFDEENNDMPHEFYMHDDETKMVYLWTKNGWEKCYRAYIAVRTSPNVSYPETVISNDGIFDSIKDAEKYIAENGGRWKVYSFGELRVKLYEDFLLLTKLEKEQIKKI